MIKANQNQNTKNINQRHNRVVIIGCDQVTASNVYLLLTNGVVEELVLIGEDNDLLLEELSELIDAAPFSNSINVRTGNYADVADADIAVIAGAASAETEKDNFRRLKKNVEIVRENMRNLARNHFDGIVLITINPVDILAQVALEESGLPVGKIIGSGTGFEMFGEKSTGGTNQVSSAEDAPVEREAATWCAALVSSVPLVDFCNPNCPEFPLMLERLHQTPPELMRRKNHPPFAVGTCVNRICKAILRNEQTILPVTTMTNGQYGIEGVYLNLPCVVGLGGIERVIEFPLEKNESVQMNASAELLKNTIKKLKISGVNKNENPNCN